MVMAAEKAVPLSQLFAELPARYTASDRLKEFPTEKSRELLAEWETSPATLVQVLGLEASVAHIDTTDGLRTTLDNGDIVHLRPSGNAPELRCYCESDEQAKASSLVQKCLRALATLPL